MRLFTAIELPEAVRAAVHAAAAPILRGLPGCRPVAAENLHVTVRFLGEVGPERLRETARALWAAAESVPAGRLRIHGFGAFPHLRRPRVVWAGVEDPEGCTAPLERVVSAALAPLGHPPEDRDWTPHVTVARLGDPRKLGGRARVFVAPPEAPIGPWFDASHLTLFESELGPGGPRYRVVDRFALRDRPLGPTPDADAEASA